MGTSALIGRVLDDSGRCEVISVHWDGYLEHAGKILKDNYRSKDKLDDLFALGNLSSLGPIPKSSHELWAGADNSLYEPTSQYYNWCKAYKDRPETETESREYKNPMEAMNSNPYEVYNYFYIDGKWYCKVKKLDYTEIIDLDTGEIKR